MEPQDDKYSMKDRILKDVGKSIKLIQQYIVSVENNFSGGGGSTSDTSINGLNNNSWLVQSLCCQIDLALRHGLRNPSNGLWPLLQGLSHSDTFQLIDGLQHISSPLGKGLSWLLHTLTEGTLQSYLLCLTRDNASLHQYYTSKALLRDSSCAQQLLTLLSGLENITFSSNMDGSEHLEASGFSGLTSMTSSISSPVDSGVLLDSDADIISTNEATANEVDSESLKDEEALLPELEDNRINDHIVSQEVIKSKDSSHSIFGYSQNFESITTSRGEKDEYSKVLNEKVLESLADCGKIMTEDNKHSIGSPLSICNTESLKGNESSSELIENCNHKIKPEVNGMGYNSCNSCDLLQGNNFNKKEMEDNRMSKSCVGLIEGNPSLDGCMSNEALDNKWSSELNTMSTSVESEGIVVKRQRKKKTGGLDTKVKRVSFHEDLLTKPCESTAQSFSASFLPPNPILKCDVVKGRYSWCAEGDAPYLEQRNNHNDTKSDVYLASIASSGKENTCEENTSNMSPESAICVKDRDLNDSQNIKLSLGDSRTPPVTERGIPEGQEDPPKTSSLLHLNSITDSVLKKFPSMASSIDWSSDTESDSCDRRITRNMRRMISVPGKEDSSNSKAHVAPHRLSAFMPASKTSLLNRFMRSLMMEKKQKQRKSKFQKSRPLYIPGAKVDPVAARLSLPELESVRALSKVPSKECCGFGPSFEKAIKGRIFQDPNENIYKVFKVNTSYFIDGKSKPLLIVLSQIGMYFVGLKSNFSYYLRLKISYQELDAIIVGPNHQTLFFVNANNSKQMIVTSSNGLNTEQIMCHIEVAMRRSPTKPSLPAVSRLLLEDMKMLKKQLSRDTAFLDGEELLHYNIVHVQDNPTSPPTTPLGPSKEGHLMFRPATVSPLQPWEPGYFVLKGGVVYMFHDRGCRLPKRVIPLHAGQCQGCRRMVHEPRPHTFEVLLGRNRSFQFAAADDYEASEWLQALVQAASGFYEMEQVNSTPCSLIITSRHILTCQEKFTSGCATVLTCAAIADLAAFSVVSDDESWCVLEFACHEVHESSGDWALYFSSSEQMKGFKQNLVSIWKNLVPKVQFPECDIANAALLQRCVETSRHLSMLSNEILIVDQRE